MFNEVLLGAACNPKADYEDKILCIEGGRDQRWNNLDLDNIEASGTIPSPGVLLPSRLILFDLTFSLVPGPLLLLASVAFKVSALVSLC
jgi:hypothetical protein